MMTKAEALKRAETLRRTSGGVRRYWDAIWALDMAYAQGTQWGNITTAGMKTQIRRLPPILKPNRTDVRVTMDLTNQMVRRTVAATRPTQLPALITPSDTSGDGLVVKDVYEELLRRLIIKTNALKVWRRAHFPRAILGTGIVRRTMSSVGRAKKLKQMSVRRPKEHLSLRNIEVGLARVAPFEIIRDPAANSLDPNENEVSFGHVKARTVEWVRKNFGVTIKTDTTFGSLMDYQQAIVQASGWGNGLHIADSKEKAVLVYEFFFQDGEEERDWPWHLIAFYNPDTNDPDTMMTPLHFERNPFYGLPFHFIHYDDSVPGPWAKGIPMTVKGAQDVQNLSWTAMVRVLVDMYPKWRIQKGTVDNADGISNAVDKPIIWSRHHPNDQAPDRIPAPPANAVAAEIAGAIKDHARSQANMSGIQFGESVKRGQSARAYETVRDSAESVMADMAHDDRVTAQEMLFGLTVDAANMLRMRPDKLRKLLGGRVADASVRKAFGKPPIEQIDAVVIPPESQRNRPASQVQDDFTKSVEMGVIDPLQAQREMLLQGNVKLDSTMADAKRKQDLEIQLLVSGEPVDVADGEDHKTALWIIQMYQSSPRWMNLDDDQRQAIEDHWAAHKGAQQNEQMFDQVAAQGKSGPPPGVQSPPGAATTNFAQVEPVGSVQ